MDARAGFRGNAASDGGAAVADSSRSSSASVAPTTAPARCPRAMASAIRRSRETFDSAYTRCPEGFRSANGNP